MTSSLLDKLPGVGEVRKKALVHHFGSVKGLLAATPDDIALVPGIGPALAVKVYNALHGLALDTQREAG
ncbi:MAG: hypothetical protein E6G66_19020 [Actinobacteria bacterium]|nr:MAG: hypothetical protein E6G66_19020 [Actinomycetota bacterium]